MKNYFCKDCLENNNGWCNLHKKQGLKNITSCDDKKTEETKIKDAQTKTEIDTESLEAAFGVIGKREMFNNIQRQMLSIDKDETINDKDKFTILKQVMVSIEQMQSMNEKIFKVDNYINSEIDRDIRENSKKISQHWLQTVGMYKRED